MVAKKRKKRNFSRDTFFSILFVFLILGAVILLVFYNFKINKRRSELIAEIEKLEKEIQALEERNAQFRAGISEKTKGSYWEGEIREQGFVREGEEQVVVVPPAKIQEEKKEETGPKQFWQVLLEKFKDFLRQ